MSEPTKKKMLEWLSRVEYLTNQYAKNSREDDRRFQILRRLIEERETWAEEAGDMIGFFGIRLPLRIKIFLERLRDFGKGGRR
jgi:hypothetical protein